jgi:leucyl aminopeptidase
MGLEVVAVGTEDAPAGAVAGVPVYADGTTPAGVPAIDQGFVSRTEYKASPGTSLLLERSAGREVVALGIGKPAALTLDALRRAGGALVRAAAHGPHATFVLGELGGLVPDASVSDVAQAVTEGALLGAYSFDAYKSDHRPPTLTRVAILVGDAARDEAAEGVRRGRIVAEATALARDLVNEPAGSLPPSRFAERASVAARAAGLGVEVWDEARIVAERLGGLLAVAAGSTQPPRLVRLRYEPEGATAETPLVALVGKGITFDSGGLSLKPPTGMMTMKCDMSGAAAVVASMVAIAQVGAPVRVVGYAPLTENLPSGSATKPGDVFTARNGKTVEVLNTDAEGRLILSDALSLAAEEAPAAIVDLATLTGACVVALGDSIAGLMGNDEQLAAQIRAAGARAGEVFWPLPLPEEYEEHIESSIADMKNIGATGQAGALSAGLLLQKFVAGRPWAHLDIAGPAFTDKDRHYLRKGGTGFAVRTLVELVSSFPTA